MTTSLTSLQHPLVKHLTKLRLNRSYREDHGTVLLEGRKLIAEVCAHTPATNLLVQEGFPLPPNIKANNTFIVTEAIINKFAGTISPEGLIAEIPYPPNATLTGKTHILAFDGVRDPGNMGTLLRTAAALGWDGAFLLDDCVDPFNDKALRAAKGATFRVPLQFGNWSDLLTLIKNENLTPIAADIVGAPLNTFPVPKKVLLIVGNESEGISDTAALHATKVTIPMSGQMESLNVAIAGGILMHTLQGRA